MTTPKKTIPAKLPTPLLSDVRALILAAREQVARAVDSGLSALYWHVGRRIHQDILHEQRAEYGQEIVSALGRKLEVEFGRGFSEKSLRRMLRFVEAFPDDKIVRLARVRLAASKEATNLPAALPQPKTKPAFKKRK